MTATRARAHLWPFPQLAWGNVTAVLVPPLAQGAPLTHNAVVVAVPVMVAWLLLPEMSVHWLPLTEPPW